jgi:hypothetical protein
MVKVRKSDSSGVKNLMRESLNRTHDGVFRSYEGDYQGETVMVDDNTSEGKEG